MCEGHYSRRTRDERRRRVASRDRTAAGQGRGHRDPQRPDPVEGQREKGLCPCTAIRRFRVTFYADEWETILEKSGEIRRFIAEHPRRAQAQARLSEPLGSRSRRAGRPRATHSLLRSSRRSIILAVLAELSTRATCKSRTPRTRMEKEEPMRRITTFLLVALATVSVAADEASEPTRNVPSVRSPVVSEPHVRRRAVLQNTLAASPGAGDRPRPAARGGEGHRRRDSSAYEKATPPNRHPSLPPE